jgi:hypothetical protein
MKMGSEFAKSKVMKCRLPDIVQVGLLLAKIPKTSSIHAAEASLRSMDPKLLESCWQIVWLQSIKLRRFRNPETILNPRSVNEGRKKRPDKDDSSSDEEADSKDFANLARAVALFLKGKEMSSADCDFCGNAGHLGTACFLNPSNPNKRLPDKLFEKLMVASSDKKKEKPKNLNHESIEIAAMARSTRLKLKRQQ